MTDNKVLPNIIPGKKDYQFTDISQFIKKHDLKFMIYIPEPVAQKNLFL